MAASSEAQNRAEFVPEFFLRDLRSSARKGEFSGVEKLLEEYAAEFGQDAFFAEAVSWAARGSAAKGHSQEARRYAKRAYDLALAKVSEVPVVAGSSLAIALGAAIEVESQLLIEEGRTDAAIALLESELETFAIHPFRIRIRKNLNVLSLAGKAAPALDWAPLPGSHAGSDAELAGRPAILLFWAHWCSDSRWQARTLARYLELNTRAIAVVAPTRLFGYITKGNPATEAEETAHILENRQVDYPNLRNVPIPFGVENFDNYGASTFPTIVGIHGDGSVAFFHPGTLKPEEFAERVDALT